VNAGQVSAWIDAEFLGQDAPALLEYPQRLGVPAATVERDHQQSAHPLAQRMIRHHRRQVGYDFLMPAERKQHVGLLFGGGGPQLAQPHPLGLRERPRHSGERDASPQRERGVEFGHRADRIAALAQLAGPAQMLLEGDGIGLTWHQVKDVAGPGGDQDPAGPAQGTVRFDDAAKARHIGVDPALGAGGRIVAPDRVDQFAPRNDPVGPHRQDGQDGLLPGLPHGQLLVSVPCCYLTKYADAQHHGTADPSARQTHPRLRSPPRAERLIKATVVCPAHPEKI
jgi:hypothetical protein